MIEKSSVFWNRHTLSDGNSAHHSAGNVARRVSLSNAGMYVHHTYRTQHRNPRPWMSHLLNKDKRIFSLEASDSESMTREMPEVAAVRVTTVSKAVCQRSAALESMV